MSLFLYLHTKLGNALLSTYGHLLFQFWSVTTENIILLVVYFETVYVALTIPELAM